MTNLDSPVRGYAGGGLEAPLWHFILHADRNSFDAMHAANAAREEAAAARREIAEIKALLAEK